MRKYLLIAATSLALAGAGAAAIAQTAPSAPMETPNGPPGGPPPGGPGMPPHGPMGPMGGHWQHGRRPGGPMMGLLGLFPRVADKQLTGPEVQKIAEAFLLWNGNRTWKVTQVEQTADQVTFAYTGPNGDVIARFAVDRRTGRPHRIG